MTVFYGMTAPVLGAVIERQWRLWNLADHVKARGNVSAVQRYIMDNETLRQWVKAKSPLYWVAHELSKGI